MKTPEYMVLDIGKPSESKKTRTHKILAQIPKGKAIVLTDEDLNLPQSKIIAKVIDPDDIPKITRKRRRKPK